MVCGDEYVLAFLDESFLVCLDNDDKYDFHVYFIH